MDHPMRSAVEALEAASAEADPDVGVGVAGLASGELQELVTRVWRVWQQVQGRVLLVLIAEAARRELFRQREYASASSMRDLVGGWLRCSPGTAGRLLWLARYVVNGTYRATGQALAAGEIDTEHARAVVKSVRALPAGVVDEPQRAQAESTMLDAAQTVDAEVTATAGRHLFEVLAPEAAQEHADRQAERERERAESSRWMEVTGFGIAGAKELRLRAECEVVDTLMRVVTPLVQPSPADTPADTSADTPADTSADTPADTSADTSAGTSADTSADTSAGTGNGMAGVAEVSGGADAGLGNAEAGSMGERGSVANLWGGAEAPGDGAGPEGSLRPIERRRADAVVEVIDALGRPDLLDHLSATQLRWLADQVDTPASDALPQGSGSDDAGADAEVDTDAKVDTEVGVDAGLMGVVDVGQVSTTTCDDSDANDGPKDGAVQSAGKGASSGGVVDVPAQRGKRRVAADAHGGRSTPADTVGSVRGANHRVGGERPSLVVIANYDHRRDRMRAGQVSSTGSGPRLASVSEIERQACEAMITPVWMSANTTPVDVAASTRFFRGKQLAALIARDKGCAFPGCSRGLRYAHAHHIRRWSDGGPTSVDNGVLLCSHHHRLMHRETGWTVRLDQDGLPEFIPPYWIDPHRQPRRHTRYQALPAAA